MSATATEEQVQNNFIDLDNIDDSLVQEVIEFNPDINPMEAPPPVSDGTHRVKLIIKENSWEQRTTKELRDGSKKDYIAVQFSAAVVDEGSKDFNKRVFGRVNTLAFDGKSEMAYILLQVFGGKDNPEARQKTDGLTYVALAKLFRNTLASEPVIRVKTQWQARYNAGTKEDPEYKTAASGMAQFPSDGQGGKRAFITVKGAGEVAAQAVIQDYMPDLA